MFSLWIEDYFTGDEGQGCDIANIPDIASVQVSVPLMETFFQLEVTAMSWDIANECHPKLNSWSFQFYPRNVNSFEAAEVRCSEQFLSSS